MTADPGGHGALGHEWSDPGQSAPVTTGYRDKAAGFQPLAPAVGSVGAKRPQGLENSDGSGRCLLMRASLLRMPSGTLAAMTE